MVTPNCARMSHQMLMNVRGVTTRKNAPTRYHFKGCLESAEKQSTIINCMQLKPFAQFQAPSEAVEGVVSR